MKVDIYNTTVKKGTYLVLRNDGNGSSPNIVPAEVLNELGVLEFWKTAELAPNIIGMNPKQVEEALKAKHYAIVQAGVQTSEPKAVQII